MQTNLAGTFCGAERGNQIWPVPFSEAERDKQIWPVPSAEQKGQSNLAGTFQRSRKGQTNLAGISTDEWYLNRVITIKETHTKRKTFGSRSHFQKYYFFF